MSQYMMRITQDVAKRLMTRMQLIRTTEELIAERYNEGKMRCPTHLCTGQEAIAAAVGESLSSDDLVVSTHRAHGHYLAKGGDLNKLIAELYGKSTGCSSGKGGSMHLVDRAAGFVGSTAIVGNTIPVGVGLALSQKLRGSKAISVVFLGDGALEEGVFYESVNFALLRRLPVLFVCENNGYSVYSGLKKRQPDFPTMHDRLSGMGLCVSELNGNDIESVYLAAVRRVEQLRAGEGPRLLLCHTYRWREHCGPNFDDELGYRPPSEVSQWMQRDPISSFYKVMLQQGWCDDAWRDSLERETLLAVKEAFEFAESSPFPPSEDMYEHVYSGVKNA